MPNNTNKKNTPNYMTPEGFERLQSKFRELYYEERPKLVETVAWAAGNGDRSENGDYIYGKRRLREIDKRLKILRDKIESAQVVDPKTVQSEQVVFGATVTILDENNQEKIYQIVGEDEIDLKKNKISWRSPIAQCLLGKKIGDEAQIQRPAGPLLIEIVDVQFV